MESQTSAKARDEQRTPDFREKKDYLHQNWVGSSSPAHGPIPPPGPVQNRLSTNAQTDTGENLFGGGSNVVITWLTRAVAEEGAEGLLLKSSNTAV